MDAFITIINAFIACYRKGVARKDHLNGVIWILAALRIFFIPGAAVKLHSLKIFTKIYSNSRMNNPLYFLVHRYYLSKRFSLSQRVRAAMSHHEYETKQYDQEYALHVYSSCGILLWSYLFEGFTFAIKLIATEDNLYEGELSVILFVDEIRLCRISYCYFDKTVISLELYDNVNNPQSN